MYFKDLTKYDYLYSSNACNIGWLDRAEAYKRGEVSEGFLDQLWGYFRYPVNVCRGFHTCNLCREAYDGIPVIKHGKEKREAGFYEIRVWGLDGKEYGAPSLIYHYITEHGYKPPQEFIDAAVFLLHVFITELICFRPIKEQGERICWKAGCLRSYIIY